MAEPATLAFEQFKILVETSTPGVYGAPCGFETRAHNRDVGIAEQMIPDCDETKPAAPRRAVESVSHSVQGDGVLALADWPMWRAWADGGQSKNIRVVYDVPLAQGGGYYQGPAVLQINGNVARKRAMIISVTLSQAGAWPWTDAAA